MTDTPCAVEGCDTRKYSRGWCKRHYQRWYLRGGDPAEKQKSGRKPGQVAGDRNPKWNGGASTHELYDIYHEMRARCSRETHPRYSDYGGRGISVHPAWVADFWQFVRDVGPRPSHEKTPGGRAKWELDRVDNNGNYEPGNI